MDSPGPPARTGRDGALSLRFARRGAATILAGCRSRVPLQVLAPLALDGATVVSMLNPTGSVLAGDRLTIGVRAEAGAHAVLTTPSATKVHRSDGAVAEQDVVLHVERDAAVEWVPDHTIPFAGAAYRQTIRAHVGPDATLILVDAFAVGRVASGQRWHFTLLDSAITVTDDDGWLLHDRLVLHGGAGWEGLGFSEGMPYLATMVVVTPVPVERVAAAVAAAVADVAGVRGGVGRLPRRGLLVRILAASAPALGDGVRASWDATRAAALGAAPLGLRKY